MKTQIIQPSAAGLMRCAVRIKSGELVAFPTETVYALGADATNPEAVKKVYDVKGRGQDKPLIVAVAKKSDIFKVAKSVPKKARVLMDRFMPGALTLILDRADIIPDIVTAGGETVAVRIPDNEIALKLITLAGRPLVVPSANTSDKPSPTLAKHVMDDLGGRIEFIIDGGESKLGMESTIIDTRVDPPAVLRMGAVGIADIERAIGKVQAGKNKNYSPARDFAPRAEVLFSAFYDSMSDNICAKYDELEGAGKKPVIICLDGNKEKYGKRAALTVGGDYKAYAHLLFATLRLADEKGYNTVIAEGVEPKGIGEALINRLVKMSKGNII